MNMNEGIKPTVGEVIQSARTLVDDFYHSKAKTHRVMQAEYEGNIENLYKILDRCFSEEEKKELKDEAAREEELRKRYA